MSNDVQSIIALFPGFDTTGGVQVVSASAWESIAGRNSEAKLVVYGSVGAGSANGAATAIIDANKYSLCLRVFRRRWPAAQAFFGHVDLLKLLPLMRGFHGRVSLFLHGIEAWRPFGWWTRRCLDRVDLFLTNSNFTWERFVELHPRFQNREHQVVHLGVDSPADSPDGPAPQPAALIVGRMARAEDYKGHRELIAAWPKVRLRCPGATLWVVGEGDLRPDLEAWSKRHGVADAVVFWGRLPAGQKQRLLKACRCLAMPSRAEGFGLVYLEAMRLGRPCLVSDRDAGREVVNPPEAGLAVDPGNPKEMVDALSRLLGGGPEWHAWSSAARARYEMHFTADQFRRRLLGALAPTSRTSNV